MALLTVSRLTKSFGAQAVFTDVSFEIYAGDRIGLVGVNGCGKTTLLKILCGMEQADGGDVVKARDTVLGYMEQHVCSDNAREAYDEVLTVFSSIMERERELADVEKRLREAPADLERLVERQVALHEELERMGGLTYRSRARSALLGLGFSQGELSQQVGTLSGGQRAKLQLAKMLLSGANLLLLDEPTNHLDIQAVEWLEGFLKDYRGAFLVISHDRYFLDAVTERTFSLRQGSFYAYKGGYTAFLRQKEQEDLALRRQYENTMKEIERLQEVVTRQRQWNREKSIKQAESNLKRIDRLREELVEPEAREKSITFQFHASRRSGDEVLSVKGLSLSFGEKKLFSGADMDIRRGEHVFLLGPNGCGKTSLLKALMGRQACQSGRVDYGAGVEVGYYDQLQSDLHGEKTVLQEIWDEYPLKTETEIRSALALFLFQGEDVYKKISALSGGERARVLLLKLMFSKANFLLLDEPTNHLDIFSCEALEDALRGYDGTLLIVSHDRYLINKIAHRIYAFEGEGLAGYAGNYDDYAAKRKNAVSAPKAETPPKQSENKQLRETESRLKKCRANRNRLEKQIEEGEAELKLLREKLEDPQTASDYKAMLEITEKIQALTAQEEELFQQWSRVSEEEEALADLLP